MVVLTVQIQIQIQIQMQLQIQIQISKEERSWCWRLMWHCSYLVVIKEQHFVQVHPSLLESTRKWPKNCQFSSSNVGHKKINLKSPIKVTQSERFCQALLYPEFSERKTCKTCLLAEISNSIYQQKWGRARGKMRICWEKEKRGNLSPHFAIAFLTALLPCCQCLHRTARIVASIRSKVLIYK